MPGSPGQPFVRSEGGMRDCHHAVTKALQTFYLHRPCKHEILIQHPSLTQSLTHSWGWKTHLSLEAGCKSLSESNHNYHSQQDVPFWAASLWSGSQKLQVNSAVAEIRLIGLLIHSQATFLEIGPMKYIQEGRKYMDPHESMPLFYGTLFYLPLTCDIQ